MTTNPTTATTTRATTQAATGGRGVLLADALSVNAISSGVTGLVLTVGGAWLDVPLGAPAPVLVAVGLGLVLFAIAILVALTRPAAVRPAARAVVVADLAWVAAAAAVLAGDLLTSLGDVALGGVSALVAGFAVAQLLGLRRAGDADELGVRPIEVRASRRVDAPPQDAWRLVADAAGHQDVAPSLASTTTDGDLGTGMRRTCVDTGGRTWQEACTSHAPGRSYRMEVDTSTYPLRHRALLHRFGMTWQVDPDGAGTRLTLTFSGAAKLGVLGRLALAAHLRDDPAGRTLDACAAQLATAD